MEFQPCGGTKCRMPLQLIWYIFQVASSCLCESRFRNIAICFCAQILSFHLSFVYIFPIFSYCYNNLCEFFHQVFFNSIFHETNWMIQNNYLQKHSNPNDILNYLVVHHKHKNTYNFDILL